MRSRVRKVVDRVTPGENDDDVDPGDQAPSIDVMENPPHDVGDPGQLAPLPAEHQA